MCAMHSYGYSLLIKSRVWFQITAGYELYVVFEPTVDKSVVIMLVNKLLGWIKKEEEMLFILNAPTFWPKKPKERNSFLKIFADTAAESSSDGWNVLYLQKQKSLKKGFHVISLL